MFKQLIFSAVLCFSAVYSQAQKNVLQCYKELANVSELFAVFTLEQKGDKWVTIGSIEQELEATVDLKNGYIRVEDDGTGGGSDIIELALFRTAANQDIIICARTNFDGVSSAQEVVVYRNENGKWNSIEVASVIPAAKYTDFANGLTYNANIGAKLPALLQIPQYGTIAKYTIEKSPLSMGCDGAFGDEDTAPYCEAKKKIIYSSIELKWDKTAQKFSIGSKK